MVSSFSGKKVLIMGLGLHGGAVAAVRWLLKHGATLTITDTKSKTQLKASLDKIKRLPQASKIKYTLGGHKAADFSDQDLIIQNPAVPSDNKFLRLAQKKHIPIVNEAVLFFWLYQGQSIGVTGTRGKSTTATLIHQILKTKIKTNVVAGNIATNPMFDVLEKLKKDSLPVLELSSWHLEVMDNYHISPHIAVVTNVLADHLNRYKNFNSYQEAKRVILKYQSKQDKIILNADNFSSRSFSKRAKATVYFYSLKRQVKGAYLKNNKIYFNNGSKESVVMDTRKIKILGQHNLANILAAVCVAKIVGIAHKNIAQAVNNFRGVPYRLEYKGKIREISVYNDSTSTTPDATLAAISAMEVAYPAKNIVLLAGGQDKNLDYKKLAREIKAKISQLILLPGTASNKLIGELKKIKFSQDKMFTDIDNLKQAFKIANQSANKSGVLLFSPAAASFNMFKNEFDRARQFDQLVYDAQKKKK